MKLIASTPIRNMATVAGNIHTMEQNSFAQERKLVEDYSGIKEWLPPGKNVYVIIMTEGYRTDKLALKALLGIEVKYLGILGSRFKIGKMFRGLAEEGVAPAFLERLHAPVGLSIQSQTPKEIAVSIAAEIIQVKNQPVGK